MYGPSTIDVPRQSPRSFGTPGRWEDRPLRATSGDSPRVRTGREKSSRLAFARIAPADAYLLVRGADKRRARGAARAWSKVVVGQVNPMGAAIEPEANVSVSVSSGRRHDLASIMT